ncbi:MAG: efflux RND transporter permease subunit [Parvularculaceae bacterium]
MDKLIDAAFARSRVVLTLLAALILAGLAAYRDIPREAEPDIPAARVAVILPLPGVSPEDAERMLVRPTEDELQSIEGVDQIDALAYDGAAQITIDFLNGVDVDQAILDVREAVDRAKSDFPDEAKEPVVEEFNAQNQFPILTVILYGDAPERALQRTAKRLEDRLEALSGVLDARLTGVRDEIVEVVINPDTLEAYGLTGLDVAGAIRANNELVPAGAVDFDDGRFQVKAPGLIRTTDDLASIAVRANADGVVSVGDVAEVRRAFADRRGHAVFNGRPAIGVELSKRAGANIVETIENARAIVAQEASAWPSSIRHEFLSDRSVEVRDNLEGLTSSVLVAIFLVMVVVVAALGLRSGLMVGVAIPTSFLIAFLALSLFGHTLNMMVMFGLVLSVGMLVDGAIVIIEFAERRLSEGAGRAAAYAEASKRMFWPVTASTATTLAAFVPFLFWNDIVGEFMKFLPLTLIFVLVASLFVALIFLPVLGGSVALPAALEKRLAARGGEAPTGAVEMDEVDPRRLGGFVGAYARALGELVRRPLLVMLAAGAAVVVCWTSFRIADPDVEFFIRNDNEEVNLLVLARGNLSADQTVALVQEVAARVEDHPAIEHIYLQTGPEFALDPSKPPEAIGQVGVDLVYYSERAHSREIVEEFRAMTRDVPGAFVEVRQREGGPPIGKDVEVEVSGVDFEAMRAAAERTRAFVDDDETLVNGRRVRTFMEQEDSLPLAGIDWTLNIDRTLAGQYGLSVREAGDVAQFVTDGLLVDRFRPDDADEDIDIRVRYPEDERRIFALNRVRAQTPAGAVPLSNFVELAPTPRVDRILRRDGARVIDVKANGSARVAGHEVSQDKAIGEMKAWLAEANFGPGVVARLRGADEETNAAAAFFKAAMSASLLMIAMILLLEFNSFYHAALTLTAVVFSVFGVLFGVALSGQYVSVIMTGVGVVALAGIVVNNNIVLIDTYQSLRRKGLSAEEAVVRTGAQRARPVLLTTATTILGLLPMVFELNVDFATGSIGRGSTTSDWWVLLSSAVVNGLAFSTLLTLVLTPVLLAAPATLRARFMNAAPAREARPARLLAPLANRRDDPPRAAE